jgi:hypothetical protein
VDAPLLEMGLGVDVAVYTGTLVYTVEEPVPEETAVGMYMLLVELRAYVEVTV